MKKSIILLEHEEEVKDCIKRFDEIEGQKLIIALSPFAMYELNKQNVSYHIPEDYYEPQELYRLGITNYQKVEQFCGIIDKGIHKACSSIAKLDITPALFSFYFLKIIYDAATIRIFQLSKLIEVEKPDVISIYDTKKYPFGITEMSPYLLFDNRESIYARILALDGWEVPVVALPPVSQPENSYAQRENYQTISNRLKNKAVGWLQNYPKLFDLALKTQRGGWHGLFSGLKSYLPSTKHMPVLLFGEGYNWNDSREELQSVGISPIIRMRDNFKHWMREPSTDKLDSDALLSSWEELGADDEFRKFFVWNNVDFFPLLEERFRFLIECLTPACINAYTETTDIIERKKIKALSASFFSTCTEHAAAQAAHNANIPVVSWQQGGYGYFNQPIPLYLDIMDSDIHLVFGDEVVKRYEKDAKRFDTQLTPVGSASLDTLNLRRKRHDKNIKLDPEKKSVLYVTTNFYLNNLYISSPPPFSDNHFWRTQRAIIDALGKHGNYTAVVKLHPNRLYRASPARLYAKGQGFKNCHFIRNECSFTDLLPLTDVIIIDFPATTLLQALTTSKPIFVYTGHLNIDKEAETLLKRRAYCYSDLGKFTRALDAFLSSGSLDVEADLNDRAFLKMYGTHLDDGESGIRAANALIKIINASKLDKQCKQKTT